MGKTLSVTWHVRCLLLSNVCPPSNIVQYHLLILCTQHHHVAMVIKL